MPIVSLAEILSFLEESFSNSIVSMGSGRHLDLGLLLTSVTRASGRERHS